MKAYRDCFLAVATAAMAAVLLTACNESNDGRSENPPASPSKPSEPQDKTVANPPIAGPVTSDNGSVNGRVKRPKRKVGPSGDDLHCRIEPTARPMSYLRYNRKARVVWTYTGWNDQHCPRGQMEHNKCWRVYRNVEEMTGLPPYFNTGTTLVAFGDVPIIHFRRGHGTIWYERNTSYPWEAYWGIAPGVPEGEAKRGVCWTSKNPAINGDINY